MKSLWHRIFHRRYRLLMRNCQGLYFYVRKSAFLEHDWDVHNGGEGEIVEFRSLKILMRKLKKQEMLTCRGDFLLIENPSGERYKLHEYPGLTIYRNAWHDWTFRISRLP